MWLLSLQKIICALAFLKGVGMWEEIIVKHKDQECFLPLSVRNRYYRKIARNFHYI